MNPTIPECDWKAFKGIQDRAQERACEIALAEVGRLMDDKSKSAHDRFRDLCRFLKCEEKDFDMVLTQFRRSAVLETLIIMDRRRLLTDEDLAQLSSETRKLLSSLRATG